jgi:3-oxoacyl-[acyl-carrier-protein] synthase-3
MRCRVTSTGFYAPPHVETAADLSPRIGRSTQWIIQRTGVLNRRISNEPVEVMAAHAARAALEGGAPPDLVVNASTTPRQLIPDTSSFIAAELGFAGVPTFSVHATCLSFLVALHNVAALVASGLYRRVLIVSSERGSIARNFDEPESAALLGDCAAAAVVEPTPDGAGSRLLSWRMGTWPDGSDMAELRGGGAHRFPRDGRVEQQDYAFHMDGPKIYRMAIRRGGTLINEALAAAHLKASDIDLVVPHQASGPGVQALERFGFSRDRIVNIVEDYGNCIAASIPAALASANAAGRLRRGDKVLIAGTGAGLSIAAAVLEW